MSISDRPDEKPSRKHFVSMAECTCCGYEDVLHRFDRDVNRQLSCPICESKQIAEFGFYGEIE